MEQIVLQAQIRTAVKNQIKSLRKNRQIPGVLYGHGIPSRNIVVNALEFGKVYKKAGASNLIDLQLGEENLKVVVKDYQLHPLKTIFTHFDLYQVRMDEELEAEAKVVTTGEAPAVKGLGGILIRNMTTLTIRCLPQNLVGELTVDISSLNEFGQSIHVKDILVPAGVKILGNPQDVVVTIAAPRSEEEITAASGAVVEDVTQVKVAADEKKKAEESAAATEMEAKK